MTSLNDAEEPELQLTRIPSFPRQVEKMVYVYVTDSAANSAWYAAMSNGHLNISVTEDMVSPFSVVRPNSVWFVSESFIRVS
jgi:hypothetical protein